MFSIIIYNKKRILTNKFNFVEASNTFVIFQKDYDYIYSLVYNYNSLTWCVLSSSIFNHNET